MMRPPFVPLLLSLFWLSAQTAQNPLPNSEMKDPAGQKVQFRFRTEPNSVQIYTCRQSGQGFAWSGPDPDAMLTESSGKLIVHHYKGPTWEATGGSVHSDGALARHYLPKNPNAVHWLELPAKEPAGQFAKVTFIHRIDTSGGLPPSGKPCDASHAGEIERVNYGATYLFYVPR
jgi:Protein of unknown function (DUF3455)